MPLMDLAIELFAQPVSSVLCSSIPQLYYSYSDCYHQNYHHRHHH